MCEGAKIDNIEFRPIYWQKKIVIFPEHFLQNLLNGYGLKTLIRQSLRFYKKLFSLASLGSWLKSFNLRIIGIR